MEKKKMLESHLRQTRPESLGAADPRNLYLQSVWVSPYLCDSLLQVKGLAPA